MSLYKFKSGQSDLSAQYAELNLAIFTVVENYCHLHEGEQLKIASLRSHTELYSTFIGECVPGLLYRFRDKQLSPEFKDAVKFYINLLDSVFQGIEAGSGTAVANVPADLSKFYLVPTAATDDDFVYTGMTSTCHKCLFHSSLHKKYEYIVRKAVDTDAGACGHATLEDLFQYFTTNNVYPDTLLNRYLGIFGLAYSIRHALDKHLGALFVDLYRCYAGVVHAGFSLNVNMANAIFRNKVAISPNNEHLSVIYDMFELPFMYIDTRTEARIPISHSRNIGNMVSEFLILFRELDKVCVHFSGMHASNYNIAPKTEDALNEISLQSLNSSLWLILNNLTAFCKTASVIGSYLGKNIVDVPELHAALADYYSGKHYYIYNRASVQYLGKEGLWVRIIFSLPSWVLLRIFALSALACYVYFYIGLKDAVVAFDLIKHGLDVRGLDAHEIFGLENIPSYGEFLKKHHTQNFIYEYLYQRNLEQVRLLEEPRKALALIASTSTLRNSGGWFNSILVPAEHPSSESSVEEREKEEGAAVKHIDKLVTRRMLEIDKRLDAEHAEKYNRLLRQQKKESDEARAAIGRMQETSAGVKYAFEQEYNTLVRAQHAMSKEHKEQKALSTKLAAFHADELKILTKENARNVQEIKLLKDAGKVSLADVRTLEQRMERQLTTAKVQLDTAKLNLSDALKRIKATAASNRLNQQPTSLQISLQWDSLGKFKPLFVSPCVKDILHPFVAKGSILYKFLTPLRDKVCCAETFAGISDVKFVPANTTTFLVWSAHSNINVALRVVSKTLGDLSPRQTAKVYIPNVYRRGGALLYCTVDKSAPLYCTQYMSETKGYIHIVFPVPAKSGVEAALFHNFKVSSFALALPKVADRAVSLKK